MREGLKTAWIILCLFFISSSAFGVSANHLMTLKSKFPYGLLGDDYGVLTINDLALNACQVRPRPFVPDSVAPYEYWQCFETKTISVGCKDIGFLEEEGLVGRVVVTTKANQIKHEFFEPRPWPLRECKNFVKRLRILINGNLHACISATFIGNELDKSGQNVLRGFLNRLKTRKGCEGEECRLTAKFRRENCPDLKF